MEKSFDYNIIDELEERKDNIVVYGTGNQAIQFTMKVENYYNEYVNIVCCSKTEIQVTEQLFMNEYKILPINEIQTDFDYIIIAIANQKVREEIEFDLIRNHGINSDIIVHYPEYLDKCRRRKIIGTLLASNNQELKDTIEYLRKNKLSVRNQYANKETVEYKVYIDQENQYPYVEYCGRRMYYPRDYVFEKNGKDENILTNIVECDQYPGSPHLYCNGKHEFLGGVLVDAGVAEGNFALKYVDKADKIYLIESDKKWVEVLKLTFAPFMDKVVIVNKRLGKRVSDNETTLDFLLGGEKCDFIKMDIEGAEPDALLGGIGILQRRKPKISVCTYHNENDYKYVSFIMKALGYAVSNSFGYMFFLFDENIDRTLDFRRGVIYGD